MFECVLCKTNFMASKNFLYHVQLSHQDFNNFQCPIDLCGRKYSVFSSFKNHIEAKHPTLNLSDLIDSPIKAFNLHEDLDFIIHTKEIQAVMENSDSDEDTSYELEFCKSTNNLIDSNFSLDNSNIYFNFIQKLYSYSDLNKKLIHEILDVSSNSIKDILNKIKLIISDVLQKDEMEETAKKINIEIDNYSKLFDKQSDFIYFKLFEKSGFLIMPECHVIGERQEFRYSKGKKVLKHVPIVSQFIPASKMLKKFFEMPDVLKKTLDYMKYLESVGDDVIFNLIQCSFWKEKILSDQNKIILPLTIFIDDYEPNNPLGSHKGLSKCCAAYYSVACLPPEIQSKIDSIFLYVLFNSLDKKVCSENIIWNKVVEELNFLHREGICVETNGKKTQLYFQLALIIGDNLGLHGVLGMQESFNSKYFCRFCLTEKENIHKIFDEKHCVLRNIENYHSMLKNESHGVKKPCSFNSIKNFHVFNNLSVDFMHDVLEGTARYDIALVLNHYIYKKKYFTLKEFNLRLNSLSYGNNNKPPEIEESHIKKGYLIMSSSEMLSFIRHINIIISDLNNAKKKIKSDDKYWELLKMIKKIVDICTNHANHKKTHILLGNIVSEYLQLLVSIDPKTIKPKHHFLIHYARIMSKIGPIWNISCMRGEGAHKPGKKIARASVSRVNVHKTIAIRSQLTQCFRFKNTSEFPPIYTFGPTSEKRVSDLKDHENFLNLFPNNFNFMLTTCNWIIANGIKISKNSIIVIFEETGDDIYIVQEIIKHSHNKVKLLVKEFLDYDFHEDYQAYIINNETSNVLKLVDVENISAVTHCNYLSNNELCIVKSWV